MKKQLKHSYYDEAMRYMDNAEQILKNAAPEDRYYTDLKYLK